MTRRPSLLAQVIARSADTLAERWHVPAESRPEFRQTFDTVMREALCMYAGDRITSRVRMYVAEKSADERQQQRRRILDALATGQEPVVIARREGVTPQWVRVLRAKQAKAKSQRNE